MRHHIHPHLCALFLALLAAVALPIQAQTIIASGPSDAARVIVKFKADSPLLRAQEAGEGATKGAQEKRAAENLHRAAPGSRI